ncbi:MAG: transposase [Planctomycetota bacterium]
MKGRVFDRERGVHFVTFSCFRRRRLLQHERVRRIVVGQLGAALAKFDGICLGFVVMPDHVHAMLCFSRGGVLADFLESWKTASSAAIAVFYETAFANYWSGLAEKRVWQRRYFNVVVETAAEAEVKLDYMHANPVRAGLVGRPADWGSSSARFYETGRSVGLPIGWPDGFY